MATTHPREDWSRRQPRSRIPLQLDQVKHVVIHWPGSKGHLLLAKIAGYLRGWQDWHMDGRGWTDIAYNEAVDQNGDVWILRGDHKDGATKNYGGRSYSILAIVGTDDTPSDAMLHALAERARHHQARAAVGCKIVGHRDLIRSTDCPGDELHDWIEDGLDLPIGIDPAQPDQTGQPSADGPAFPLPAGYYYGPRTGPVRSVSGYYSTRSTGCRGDDGLAQAQQQLTTLGHLAGAPDGLYGPRTAAAVRNLQQRAELPADGLLGAHTWPHLWNH